MMKSTKQRESNIELMRIILIVFIIGFHVLSYGTLHPVRPLSIQSLNFFSSVLFESIFVVAVNCFILISGYYQINANRNKFARLYSQVFFYSIFFSFIFLVYYYFTNEPIDIKNIYLSFIPFFSQRWWFFTHYIILFISSPFLNLLSNNLNQLQLRNLILGMIVLFVIAPTISFPIVLDRGFGFVSFYLLYLIGSYIKKYVQLDKIKTCKSWGIYIFSVILIVGYAYFLASIGKNYGYKSASFAYNNLLVFIASILFFICFLKLKVKTNRFINGVSGTVFGIYLFHEHPNMKEVLYEKVFHCSEFYDSYIFLPYLFFVIFTLFIVGSLFEYLRIKLLSKKNTNLLIGVINKLFPNKIF